MHILIDANDILGEKLYFSTCYSRITNGNKLFTLKYKLRKVLLNIGEN